MEVVTTQREDGEIIKVELSTTVRGQEITFSPEDINRWLGVEDVPGELRTFEISETVQIFKPIRETTLLNFTPSGMCDFNRIVHYIYSRNMVNKANNFTHFSRHDYQVLPAILSGVRVDIGRMIFEEMRRFIDDKGKHTPIPYPQLVSFILAKHNVWYLEDHEPVIEIKKFGEYHMNRMKIKWDTVTAPRRTQSQAGPSHLQQDEAQSSAPPPSASSGPSFMGASMRLIIQEELDLFEAKLMPVLERHNLAITQSIGTLIERVERLEGSVASLVRDHPPSPAAVAPEVGLDEPVVATPSTVQTQILEVPAPVAPVQPSPDPSSPDTFIMGVIAELQEAELQAQAEGQGSETVLASSSIPPSSQPLDPSSPTFHLPITAPSSGSTAELFADAKGGDSGSMHSS